MRPTEDQGVFKLVQTPKLQGALFSMENKTGYVKAMIGGYDYRNSEFNRSMQSLRQPGSAFKPFVYSAALDKGFTYSTPVADTPIAYRTGLRQIWSPKNYGGRFSGVGTFASHITYSRNVPTVKIGQVIGLHYLTAFCRKLGLTSPIGKYLSMSLGANGVYMNEMVRAYATFANYGVRPQQIFVTKITDAQGDVIKDQSYVAPLGTEGNLSQANQLADDTSIISDHNSSLSSAESPADLNHDLWEANRQWIEKDDLNLEPEEIQVLYGAKIPPGHVLTPQTAYLTTGLLRKVVQNGTGVRVKALGRPVAGKTGTTNDETDTWFIGYTPELTAAVWVGYDSVRKIGRGEQGGRTAAPIFLQYMKKVYQDVTTVTNFTPPPGFKTSLMASLPGGSSSYWHGGMLGLAKEAEELTAQHEEERSAAFFESDFVDF